MLIKILLSISYFIPNLLVASCLFSSDFNLNKIYKEILIQSCNKFSKLDLSSNKEFLIIATNQIKEPNAFAVKNSSRQVIFISDSLIDLYSKNPSALNFVVAHEIAHFSLGHVKDDETINIYKKLIISGINSIGLSMGFIGENLVKLLLNINLAKYSQTQEYVGDKLAMDLMLKSNYSREDAIIAIQILKEESKSKNYLNFLSSHPDLELRLKKLKDNKNI
jgi:Zn-dependent protease with chaperone function